MPCKGCGNVSWLWSACHRTYANGSCRSKRRYLASTPKKLRRVRVVVPVGSIVQRVRVTLDHDRTVKTIYDRIHRPADEITVDLTATPGDRVEVYIEDQRVERIRL